MKITFLGTSHGVPARGRNCSSAMLEVGDAIYFIDGGAPMIEEFLKIRTEADLNKARAVFTTHSHGDHTAGIFHFTSLMSWFYKLPFKVYLTEQQLIDAMHTFYRATSGGGADFNPELISFHLEHEGVVYEDENVKLTFIPTAHMANVGAPAYSILVEAEGKRVLFSGDLSQHLSKNDVPKIVTTDHLDLFICEMAHFSLEELKPTLDKCLADRVLINHIWRPIKFDEIRALSADYAFELRTVDDGEVVEV